MSNFSNAFKALRIRDNLTQEELAIKLGVSRSTIGMYEQGKREPGIEGLESIADFFNVDMNDLTGANNDNDYYDNLQIRQISQLIHENKELLKLFKVAKNISEDDLPALTEIAKKLVKE